MSKVHKVTFMQEMVDLVDKINPPVIEIHGKKFVQVVQCKDCVCCDRDNGSPWCGLIGLHVDSDHYCAWGERKNGIL